MYNPQLTKAKRHTTADALPYTIAKWGATTTDVTGATAATDRICGVFTEVGAKVGEIVDVVHDGRPGVKLGGTVALGDKLTTNASGQAIATTTAGNRVLGVADSDGVSGDVIPVLLTIGDVI
jgi:surface antigen